MCDHDVPVSDTHVPASARYTPADVAYPHLTTTLQGVVQALNSVLTQSSSVVNNQPLLTTGPFLPSSAPGAASMPMLLHDDPSMSTSDGSDTLLDSHLEKVFGGIFDVSFFGTRDSSGSFMDDTGFDTRESYVFFCFFLDH